MSFARRKCSIKYDYRMTHTSIERCIKIKDLVVTFDTELSFRDHIKNVVTWATKMLILRTTKRFNKTQALNALYFALFRLIV